MGATAQAPINQTKFLCQQGGFSRFSRLESSEIVSPQPPSGFGRSAFPSILEPETGYLSRVYE